MAFSKLNINLRVSPFNKTILIIASNYIPQETVMCDDREILELKILLTMQKHLLSGKNAKVFKQSKLNE